MIKKSTVLENLKTLIYALVIAIIIRSLILQPFYIPSPLSGLFLKILPLNIGGLNGNECLL